ncbi:MAG: MCE family protein [Deltaproteobacteria bacterium]|nr:MCE family protein [Deltaproteobacteria bacterium]
MIERKKFESIVGLFVVASMAALLVMVLIIAQQERLWVKHAEFRAIFKNAGGLKAGSEVRLAGLTVGNVKQIHIDAQGHTVVVFEVVEQYSDRIRQDSRATIGYMGLLGEKSLDLSTGSSDKPGIPLQGIVTSIEPLDITELFAKAQPSLENLQKIINNLAQITQDMASPESDVGQFFKELHEIAVKINQAKGTLGLILNDPKLYQETSQAAAGVRKFADGLSEGKGLIGAMINDPALKAEAQKTLADLHATFDNLKQASANLKEAANRFPEMAKKGEALLDNLSKAGKYLPDLVVSGQEMTRDVEKVAEAAQKSWLLKRNVPKPKEQTIRVE